jgi:hypothetical protein
LLLGKRFIMPMGEATGILTDAFASEARKEWGLRKAKVFLFLGQDAAKRPRRLRYKARSRTGQGDCKAENPPSAATETFFF